MNDEKYQFESLVKYKNVTHGVSSKAFGSMKSNQSQLDREKLAAFEHSIGITGDIVCMKQIHSGNVQVVENLSELRFSETDALITSKKHLPLAVFTADCLPILFFDPKNEVIALAHAGYKGLLNHIIENVIYRFVSDFGSHPIDILVGIGPSIEMKCYEVGKDRIEEFEKKFPKFVNIFTDSERKFYLNLRAVAAQCLFKEGILKEHIEIMDICTKCDPNFYSYRGGDNEKRFVSLISLV